MTRAIDKSSIRCVAVIQCEVTRERCPGGHCAIDFAKRRQHFEGYGPDVIFAPIPCGGCPGRRISRTVRILEHNVKNEGITHDQIAVHLASCMVFDSNHYPPCPNLDYIKRMLTRRGWRFVEGTHESNVAARRRASGDYV